MYEEMIPRIYRFLLRAGKIAGGATFIFGIFYGFFQYYELKKEKRIEQTLSWYRQFNSPPFSGYRENINRALAKNRDAIRDAAKDEQQLTERMIGIIDSAQIEYQLLLLMDFFDGLMYCMQGQLCDNETTINLFHMRARELYITFYQYMAVRRQVSPEFGAGLEKFAMTDK